MGESRGVPKERRDRTAVMPPKGSKASKGKAPAKKSAPKKAIAKKSAKKSAKKGSAKKDKVPRPPSAYNLFMKKELPAWKKKNPKADHKEAFAAVAKMWSTKKK